MFVRAIARELLMAAIMASAVVAQAVTIDTVWVGNVGNVADPTTGGPFSPGYGAVGYGYEMGKYEVTNSQYCEFLNAKAATDTYALYNTGMSSSGNGGINRSGSSGSYTYAVKSGYENMPVTYVSWYDAVRFVNWLQNGQGSGSTESGTYTITDGGANSGNESIPDAATRATWGAANPHWVLPSENEWYKAAYHQPASQGGDTDNYWLYPTATNSEPHWDNPASLTYPTNSANCFRAVTGPWSSYDATLNYLTNAGAYTLSDSFYGTFDQGGNVREWTDEVNIFGLGYPGFSYRVYRGGSCLGESYYLKASAGNSTFPGFETHDLGFRVALVPEPGSLVMTVGLALTALLYCRRRHV